MAAASWSPSSEGGLAAMDFPDARLPSPLVLEESPIALRSQRNSSQDQLWDRASTEPLVQRARGQSDGDMLRRPIVLKQPQWGRRASPSPKVRLARAASGGSAVVVIGNARASPLPATRAAAPHAAERGTDTGAEASQGSASQMPVDAGASRDQMAGAREDAAMHGSGRATGDPSAKEDGGEGGGAHGEAPRRRGFFEYVASFWGANSEESARDAQLQKLDKYVSGVRDFVDARRTGYQELEQQEGELRKRVAADLRKLDANPSLLAVYRQAAQLELRKVTLRMETERMAIEVCEKILARVRRMCARLQGGEAVEAGEVSDLCAVGPASVCLNMPSIASKIKLMKKSGAMATECMERFQKLRRNTHMYEHDEDRADVLRKLVGGTEHITEAGVPVTMQFSDINVTYDGAVDEIQRMFELLVMNDNYKEGRALREWLATVRTGDKIAVDDVERRISALTAQMADEYAIAPDARKLHLSLQRLVFPQLHDRLLVDAQASEADAVFTVQAGWLASLTLQQLGVPDEYVPTAAHGGALPYEEACDVLSDLPFFYVPLEMVHCILKTVRVICECAREAARQSCGSERELNADYMLPIFVFVIVHAELTNPHQCVAFIRNMAMHAMMEGEAQYYLTMWESAVMWISAARREDVIVDAK